MSQAVRNEVKLDDKLASDGWISLGLWLVWARAVALIVSPRFHLSTTLGIYLRRLPSCRVFMNPLRIAMRTYSTMSSATPSCSPFTRAVVSSMRKLYVFIIGAPRNRWSLRLTCLL